MELGDFEKCGMSLFPELVYNIVYPSIGRASAVKFRQIFVLRNSLNFETSDVINIYVYRMGIRTGDTHLQLLLVSSSR